ncbi:MAG: MATE family efflux transporter [Pirellulales bacterium]
MANYNRTTTTNSPRLPAALTEGPILRAILQLSVPIVAANILQSAYSMTDTFWVGRISPNAVAAVTLSFPINFLLIAIGGGLPIAGSVLIAQYKGRGDDAAMNHVAAQTLVMVFLVSLILAGSGFMLAEPTMRLMKAEPDVLPDAVRFMQVSCFSFPFVFGFYVYQSLMRGLGEVKTPVYIVLVTVLLNLVLDPFFIFGWGPVPAWGVAGAAVATVFTQGIATAIGFWLLFSGRYGLRLRLVDFRPDWAFMWRAFRLGVPASLEQALRALSLMMLTFLVSPFGKTVMAAFGVGLRVTTFVLIPAMGFSMATSTLVGQNIGAGKIDRAARTNTIATPLSFGVLQVFGFLLMIFARPVSLVFLPDGGRPVDMSVTYIWIVASTFGCIGVQQVITGTFRGAGDTTAAMLQTLVSQWVLRFPLAYVLSQHTPLAQDGVWWSINISNVLAAIVTLVWLAGGKWKTKKLIEEMRREERLQEQVAEEAALEEGIST